MRRVVASFPTVALSVVVLFATGCTDGGAPVVPTPVNVAGAWSGTVRFVSTASGFTIQPIQMTLTQADTTVNGTYATQDFSGNVTGGTTTNTFSGTLTFNGRTTGGAACTGTFAASGLARASTLDLTSPGVAANCTGAPTSITITLQRR